jgi:hypothetical protein
VLSQADELQAALRCDRPHCACSTRRGPWHCPSHFPDRHPSLAITERKGKVLFICRSGCSQTEVLDGLRSRGLWRPASAVSGVAAAGPRRHVGDEAQREPWARPGVLDLYCIADGIRQRHSCADHLRRTVTRAGDCERAWDDAAVAAAYDLDANRIENDFDEAMK